MRQGRGTKGLKVRIRQASKTPRKEVVRNPRPSAGRGWPASPYTHTRIMGSLPPSPQPCTRWGGRSGDGDALARRILLSAISQSAAEAPPYGGAASGSPLQRGRPPPQRPSTPLFTPETFRGDPGQEAALTWTCPAPCSGVPSLGSPTSSSLGAR